MKDTNPGLAPFDLTGYAGHGIHNFFQADSVLVRLFEKEAETLEASHARAMQEHLEGFGKLTAQTLDGLIQACHKEGKWGEIQHYDRTGQRIDEIIYSEEQKQVRRLAYEYGIVNLDFHPGWKYPFTFFHRMALAFIANMNGEGGYTCPLAMTDGMILAIKEIGNDAQKSSYLPLIAGPESRSHFMCGQYVTERVGGSNVAANRTVARKMSDGSWRLYGEKWFCSNPGDLWVSSARIEGTSVIGLFLVPRLTPSGLLNACHLLRKKDIIGSRGKITAEAVYEDCYAEALGRPGHGLANLLRYIIKTSRLHVAVSGLGMGRRAILEARAYVQAREAYGRKIGSYPVVVAALAEMEVRQAALTFVCFYNFKLAHENKILSQLLTPLLKYAITVHATWATHEAIMLHGGNGILDDFSILPRLHNDSIINETWEGTHQIIAEHALKALGRPGVLRALDDLRSQARAKELPGALLARLADQETHIAACLKLEKSVQELNRLAICSFVLEHITLLVLCLENQRKNDVYSKQLMEARAEMCREKPDLLPQSSLLIGNSVFTGAAE